MKPRLKELAARGADVTRCFQTPTIEVLDVFESSRRFQVETSHDGSSRRAQVPPNAYSGDAGLRFGVGGLQGYFAYKKMHLHRTLQ